MSTSPFKREHIVKALFDLDLSSSEPSTANKTSKPRDRNRPVVSKRPTNEAKGNNQVTFLTLPVEIRLQIYDLLLVSRNSVTGEKRSLPMFKDPGDEPRLHPAILQTCKQIYHEANSIVWSQNIFYHDELEQMIRFIGYIGLANFKLIKNMEFWVPWTAGPSSWVRLFRILAGEASGLRSVSLSWGTSYEYPHHLDRRIWREGLGDNLDFVRALGEIKGLEELVIQGYYAKNWPAYLEKKMGLRVRAICAHCSEIPVNDKELADRIRKRNVGEMQRFRQFQRGTEDLFP